jgi:hypothetical protein
MWDVSASVLEWDQAEITFRLTVENPAQFFPVACMYSVEVLCKNTRWRSAVTRSFGAGPVEVPLKIARRDIAGATAITPQIVLAEPRPARSGSASLLKGSRLAVGFSLNLQADPPQEQPGAGIEIVWYRFPDEINDSMYQLIIEPPQPILRLNNRHPSLKAIFETRAKSGPQARIRNAMFSLIATDVWMQLAEYASRLEKMDLDDVSDPSAELSRKIINTLSRMIKRPAEEIISAFDDHNSRSNLTLRIQHHLKMLGHQNALVQGLIDEEQLAEFFE